MQWSIFVVVSIFIYLLFTIDDGDDITQWILSCWQYWLCEHIFFKKITWDKVIKLTTFN